MSADKTTIVATPRTIIGKANRRLASAGQIPAVLYGHGREPKPLAVDRHDFELFLSHHASGGSVLSLTIEGESKPVNAMVKELQMSPVKGTPMHIDFIAIRMDEKIQTTVPIHAIGDSPGVKTGGMLMQPIHTLSVEALPADLPEMIEIDITSLELGDMLTVADIVPPAGVTILDDPETLVCTVSIAKAAEEAEAVPAEEEAAEPALVGEEAGESEE